MPTRSSAVLRSWKKGNSPLRPEANPFPYWAPRILAIIYIFFLVVFSLDVFGENLGFWGTTQAFFLHNIPTLVLAVLLGIAWKREFVGGFGFGLVATLYLVWAPTRFRGNVLFVDLAAIAGSALLISLLFTWEWFRKKKASRA